MLFLNDSTSTSSRSTLQEGTKKETLKPNLMKIPLKSKFNTNIRFLKIPVPREY